jgi:hypothetical protein
MNEYFRDEALPYIVCVVGGMVYTALCSYLFGIPVDWPF